MYHYDNLALLARFLHYLTVLFICGYIG